METNLTLEELKNKILADAISAIDIIDVDIKYVNEKSVHLYIKTNNLKTVDSIALAKLCKKYSNETFDITQQISTHKIIDGVEYVNKDQISIYIEMIQEIDLGQFVQFG